MLTSFMVRTKMILNALMWWNTKCDTKPIRKPPYRTPYALRQEMKNQVQKMLDKGVIRV